MRKSICGSLRHLGADLYSSSLHFIHEIVQNADDNNYAKNVTPTLCITVSEEHIIISNNEIGFLARDVQSVCSLAVTTKTGGVHIGQKGLGFKSIFSCTDKPIIISNQWSFGFNVPGTDEMSYITPLWVEDKMMNNVELDKNKYNTFIYMPLKDSLRGTDFIDQVVSTMNQNLLVSLRNLRAITLIDRRNSKTSTVTFSKEIETVVVDAPTENIENVQNFEVKAFKLKLKSQNNDHMISQEYVVYEGVMSVPSYIVEEESSRSQSHKTRILYAFPCSENEEIIANKNFPIYSFLPVQDIGLKFILNCDWVLVTSRESVRENSWNRYLRDTSADLFMWILLRDKNLR